MISTNFSNIYAGPSFAHVENKRPHFRVNLDNLYINRTSILSFWFDLISENHKEMTSWSKWQRASTLTQLPWKPKHCNLSCLHTIWMFHAAFKHSEYVLQSVYSGKSSSAHSFNMSTTHHTACILRSGKGTSTHHRKHYPKFPILHALLSVW